MPRKGAFFVAEAFLLYFWRKPKEFIMNTVDTKDFNGRQLFTEKEVASILACSLKALQAWRMQRRGPCYHKVGRIVRYSSDDIQKYLAESRITHAGSE
jgi:hypothetical protein